MKIERKECWNANGLEVSVGTNCPKGGDSGAGGRTYFQIKDLASTDLEATIYEDSGSSTGIGAVEIRLGGDAECDTFIEALEFAVATLKRQRAENKAGN